MKYFVFLFVALAAQPCNQKGKSTPAIYTYSELKIRLVDSLGVVDFCDKDYFPVGRPDVEEASAKKYFDTIHPNSEELHAIAEGMVIKDKTNLSDDEKLTIYRQHKALAAIVMDTLPFKYTFKINTKTPKGEEWQYEGQITPTGQISVASKKPFKLNCPICLPYNALIETPKGNIEVKDLKAGDPVFTADVYGHRMITTILTTGQTPVPPDHKMIHIKLNDGRKFMASFKHPLANGVMLSQLKMGEAVQGSTIIKLDTICYSYGYTYDILPNGTTGCYYINGILIGSTLSTNSLALAPKNF